MDCGHCKKTLSYDDETFERKGKTVCLDCACGFDEASYFDEQEKKEIEIIKNFDDCNSLGVVVL
jgi:hypothetical protein